MSFYFYKDIFYVTNQIRTTVFSPRVNNSNFILFWFSLKQAFEVDKPLGDATRDADFTMEVVTLLKIEYLIDCVNFKHLQWSAFWWFRAEKSIALTLQNSRCLCCSVYNVKCIISFQVLGSLQSRSRAELIAMVLSMQREMDCLREQIRSLTGKVVDFWSEIRRQSPHWVFFFFFLVQCISIGMGKMCSELKSC